MEEMLSVSEVAAKLGCSISMVYKLVKTRRIACLHLGRKKVLPLSAVNDYLASYMMPVVPKEKEAEIPPPLLNVTRVKRNTTVALPSRYLR